jgi:hypothetical protein
VGRASVPHSGERVHTVAKVLSLPLLDCQCLFVDKVFGSSTDVMSCERCTMKLLTVLKTSVSIGEVLAILVPTVLS